MGSHRPLQSPHALGLAASFRGKKIASFGNHHDIPATILSVLGYPTPDFRFGRNLFSANPTGGFAYFTNENGLGWAIPSGEGFFDFGSQKWEFNTGNLDSTTQNAAKSYLQVLYDDFLRL